MKKKKFISLKRKYLKHLVKGDTEKSTSERRELLGALVDRADAGKKFSARFIYH